MIQLLCPTCNEKLSCPDTFAGKLGKCPHCQSKFKVPVPKKNDKTSPDSAESIEDSDILAEDAAERVVDSDILDRGDGIDEMEQIVDSDILDRREDRRSGLGKAPPPPSQRDEIIEADVVIEEPPPKAPPLMPPGPSNGASMPAQGVATYTVHPMALLFATLWEQKQRGASLEMQTKDGEKIAPESYAPSLSQLTHGVFAIKTLDGAHTMVSVAWDTVARVTLKGVRELPRGIFT